MKSVDSTEQEGELHFHQLIDINMLTYNTYSNFMISFYAYGAVASAMLVVILGVITCINRFRELMLIVSTVGVFFDFLAASLGSYVTKRVLLDKSNDPDWGSAITGYYLLSGSVILLYVLCRAACTTADRLDDILDGRNMSPIEFRCWALNFLFCGAVVFLLLSHCIVGGLWLIFIAIRSPLNYIINGH